jgi:hypothetical protein
MLIHRILRKPQIKRPTRRLRRFSTGLSLEMLSLENRIALSSGLVQTIEMPEVARTLNVDLYVPALPSVPAIATALAEAKALTDESGNITSEIDATSQSTSATSTLGQTSLSTVVEFNSNATNDGASVAISSTSTSEGALPGSPVQAADGTAEQGRISQALQDHLFIGSAVTGPEPAGLADPAERLNVQGLAPGGPLDPAFFMQVGPLVELAAQWRSGVLPSVADDTSDDSDDGPIGTIEPVDSSSTWLTTPVSSARAPGRPFNLLLTDASLLGDWSGEIASTSGLSYLATTGSTSLLQESAATTSEDVFAGEDDSTEPILPASITVGGVSLNILLNSADIGIQTEPPGLEQVAELVPVPESSLALAATLWSASADSLESPGQWRLEPENAADLDARGAFPSSWAVFVMGVDQALEQTCRDVQEGIRSADGPEASSGTRGGNSPELIEWHGPILPAARCVVPNAKPKSTPAARPATLDAALEETLPSDKNSRPRSEDQQPLTLGVVPTISLVSVSTLIARWIWRKREQWQQSRLARSAPKR